MRWTILSLAALAVAVSACAMPDFRGMQRADCVSLGGDYRVSDEGSSEDECAVPTRNGRIFVIEYDEIYSPPEQG
jgi:hypothetical protein